MINGENRKELFLGAIAGQNDIPDDPRTKEELYLSKIAEISAIITDIPDTDGDYFLKMTVSDGAVSYSWEAIS